MPHAVSSRKGGAKKGAPAHQNSWGFRHNKHSKVSKRIEAIPLDNVCRRCHDQLEWRKKYRKYKPRTVLGRCNGCGQKNVKAAYIMFCEQCIADKRVCGKCGMSEDDPEYGGSGGSGGGGGLVLPAGHPLQAALDDLGMDAEELLEALERGTLGLRERERRTLLRQLTSALAGEGGVEEEGGAEDAGGEAAAQEEEKDEGGEEAATPAAAAGSGGAGDA